MVRLLLLSAMTVSFLPQLKQAPLNRSEYKDNLDFTVVNNQRVLIFYHN